VHTVTPEWHSGVVPGTADQILECVEGIPAGRVMTYGDVAEWVGIRAPRMVGRVLAQDGGSVPWHRVVRADGSCAEHIYPEQRQRLLAEGVLFDGDRIRLAEFRWDGRKKVSCVHDGLTE
jgi:alkylated DNA nucleotide flippase Atl1